MNVVRSETIPKCSNLVKSQNSTLVTDWDQSIQNHFRLKADRPVNNVELIVEYDEPVYQLYSTFGIFKPLTNHSHIMILPGFKLSVGQNVPVDFYAWYEKGSPHPLIIKITMNGRLVCREDENSNITVVNNALRKDGATTNGLKRMDENVIKIPFCNDSAIYSLTDDPKSNEGRYSATLKLHTVDNRSITNPFVEIIFDSTVYILGTKLFPSTTKDAKKFRIEVLEKVTSKKPLLLKFFITYSPLEKRPRIEEVSMAGVTMCRSPGAPTRPQSKLSPTKPTKNQDVDEGTVAFTEP